MKRSNNARGIFIMSVSCWDMEKWRCSHNCRRTKAIASAKVGRVLRYHAVLRTQVAPFSISRWARQRDDRVEAQQRRGGAGNGAIIPLALRFHPQMRPRFFKRHFHGPAPDKPGQHLRRGMLQIGRQQGLRFEALLCGSRIRTQRMATGGFPV